MEKEKLIQRIANHQLLHASFDYNLGLLNGKMGCILFFFHYARYTGNKVYDDFACKLLNEIYEDIHADTPVRFSSGLTGIACGITYLIYAKFVEGNADDVLKDIDNKIMEKNLYRINDYSFETGLEGIVWYALCRLYSDENKPFNAVWLNDLQQVSYHIEEVNHSQGIQLLQDFTIGKKIENPFPLIIEKIIKAHDNETNNSLSWQKGLSMILS